jgi:hypothetical protein
VKAAEAFGNQLLKLHFVLGAVQSEFDAGSFEQKRASLRLALIALSVVIANTFPNGAELAAPINELAYALEDLDQGRRPALLQAPKARRGRPGTSNSSRLFRALAAALMEFELRTEGSKERDTIRRWAEERGGRPAMVEGTQILRFDFGEPDEKLNPVAWEEFFKVFDDRDLEFLHQDHTHDGKIGRFNKFVHAGSDREHR